MSGSEPKKPKGFRDLAVRDVTFRWRFRTGPSDSELVVIGPHSTGCRLVITLRGWQDPWLALSGMQLLPDGKLQLSSSARNDPPIVAPAFVRLAIEQALDHGWQPGERTQDLRLDYQAGTFTRRLSHS